MAHITSAAIRPLITSAERQDRWRHEVGLNIFFDFDYTLVAKDGTLRPGARSVLARLNSESHRVFIWSGMGLRAEEVADHGLMELVQGVFRKPIEDFERGLTDFGIPHRPDAVVDDHPEIVHHFGGVLIRPYFWPDPGDAELERVYRELVIMADRFAARGTPKG